MTALVFLPAAPAVATLPRYEAMRDAVALCASIDEAKEISDRAEAIAAYARLRDDRQLMVWAQEIRLRAGRRIGEILRDIERQRTGRPKAGSRPAPGPSLISRAIQDAGLRRGTAYELQEIAGPRDANLKAVADAATEGYFVQAKASQEPPTQAGLKAVVVAAMHAAMGPEEIARLAKRYRRERQAKKAEKRAANELRLGERTRAANANLGRRRYGVILADPEWQFEVYSDETGLDRAAANHYPTSPLAAICARDVASIAADDCVLALWATVPMLLEAFVVLDAWRFARIDRNPETGFLEIDRSLGRYVSSGVWTKYWPGAGIGMGHWFRVDHEILLLATRGDPPAPAKGEQWRSIFDVPASEVHSKKPDLVCEMLEALFPTLPKIELNRRGAGRPGWDVWGNEAVDKAAA